MARVLAGSGGGREVAASQLAWESDLLGRQQAIHHRLPAIAAAAAGATGGLCRDVLVR